MEFLAASIIIASAVLGCAVFFNKTLRIEITHKTDHPIVQEVPISNEPDDEDSKVRIGMAQAMQEMMGVFADDSK